MYLRVFKDDIIDGISKATGIISQKTGAAYLRTLWLSSKEDSLNIMSTDGNIEFTGTYQANVLEPGVVGVSGKKISDLIKKLKPGEIIIKADEKQSALFISQDKRRYKLPTSDSSWFPDMEEFPGENNVLWSGEIFRELMEKTYFCISDEEISPGLTCLSLKRGDLEKTEIQCCGFDTQNMCIYTLKNEGIYELIPEDGVLMAKKYLAEFRKWLPSKEIEISISRDRFFVRTEDLKECISFPLNFQKYSDYREILDYLQNPGTRVRINRRDLMESLDRINIFSTSLNKAAIFDISREEMKITSTAIESGEAQEVLKCENDGNTTSIVFNVKSMMDILAHFASEEVEVLIINTLKPCKITGKDDHNFFTVTMPVSVEEVSYYTEEEEE